MGKKSKSKVTINDHIFFKDPKLKKKLPEQEYIEGSKSLSRADVWHLLTHEKDEKKLGKLLVKEWKKDNIIFRDDLGAIIHRAKAKDKIKIALPLRESLINTFLDFFEKKPTTNGAMDLMIASKQWVDWKKSFKKPINDEKLFIKNKVREYLGDLEGTKLAVRHRKLIGGKLNL